MEEEGDQQEWRESRERNGEEYDQVCIHMDANVLLKPMIVYD